MCDYQLYKWNEKFNFDKNDIKNLESKYADIYEPNYEGPFAVREAFKLLSYPIFEEFIAELQYEFLGPLNELINLLGKGYDTLQVAAFLSLEYETIVRPDKILRMVNHLETEELIKKK